MVFYGWSGVDFKPGRRTRRSTFDPGHTHTRTACERRKRVAKGCVCGGVVDGPTRAARLHGLKCYTCVYVCFRRTLHVMAWRLPRHGSERIHRSCRSRVRSDLLHKSIPFSRTRRSLWGMPTHIHDAQPTHTRAHAGWESIFGSKLPRLEATLTTNATIRSCLQRQQHHVCEPNGR